MNRLIRPFISDDEPARKRMRTVVPMRFSNDFLLFIFKGSSLLQEIHLY